jgi:hypothetical protein
VTTKALTPVEEKHIENIKLCFDSMRDWFAIMTAGDDDPIAVDGIAPRWVHTCAARLEKSLLAPVNSVLSVHEVTPYRVGYSFGIMKWGANGMSVKPPPEVKQAFKKIRLAKKARHQAIRLWQDFLVSIQILTRKTGRLQLAGRRELNVHARKAEKYSGDDERNFFRGLSNGLHGVGRNVPGDKSTDATQVYLQLVIFWRFVVRFPSVSQLHEWLVHSQGASLIGDKKRIEKICQRIGLKLSEPGRPTKNPTLALQG